MYSTARVELLMLLALVREGEDAVSFDAIDMLNALMEPMHDEYDLSQEQLNKRSILSTKKFIQGLFDIFIGHIVRLCLCPTSLGLCPHTQTKQM